jgi:hypothetical protein
VAHGAGDGASTRMAGAEEESATRARTAGIRLWQLRRGADDSDRRKNKTSAVNLDLAILFTWGSIRSAQ